MGLPFLLALFSACKKGGDGTDKSDQDSTGKIRADFVKGADVSWLTQMEGSGVKFYNSIGIEKDCFQVLKDKGINTIRLRVFVNPTDGWCDTEDMIAKAVRAKKLGLKIMVDFHYSDGWADPAHQTKPFAWAGLNFAGVVNAMHDYTVNVMDSLKVKGITPEYVQVGNETNDGMLWPEGQASKSMVNFSTLVTAGYNAVKEVSSTSKVIVHISNGYDNALFRWVFDGLKKNGAKWDVIGMSLYPTTVDWADYNNMCLANMKDMIARYDTPVMICEVGMDVNQPATTKLFISDLAAKVNSLPNNKGLGVLYWEPESYANWAGYTMGAYSNLGRPTIALDAFAN
ncbi:cellulase family glycosylhydrolase [Mucilaginibacter sp. R11]|uniref:Arabinogalactan endo-beta-1,4-galactanase n=2 Tax=Mucilaginibacter agri TaxID=2695265 RepID=A0A965ZD88_9SPHI|nr:cellulase family glycosylhydrolase [Mucilaginibacter agri]